MFNRNDEPQIMGILNVTPDSFSDGGLHAEIDAALLQAEKMLAEGANIIDVGGESTRPGSEPVSEQEQINRVLPVIQALHQTEPTLCISIDTTRQAVAEAACKAGASIINDVSAGIADPNMLDMVANNAWPIILMHMQGIPKTMQENPFYIDVVSEVISALQQRIYAALKAGVKPENIAIDPGIGFGKRKQDNLDLLAHLASLAALGFPFYWAQAASALWAVFAMLQSQLSW
jgi:dihydropteroate synthase